MIIWAILLLVAVWLCAYAAVRRGAFGMFYMVAVLPLPVGLGTLCGMLFAPGQTLTLILLGIVVAAVAYPLNHKRLTLER